MGLDQMLALRFRDVIANAPLRPMAEVAPLVRREIRIDPQATYTELGVRSFYNGTFQRRTVRGADFTWQDIYRIHAGDLIFSNIMAWEQAIAIAPPEDDGCVGNHRMRSCEANPEFAESGFLWYYFTTSEGFGKNLCGIAWDCGQKPNDDGASIDDTGSANAALGGAAKLRPPPRQNRRTEGQAHGDPPSQRRAAARPLERVFSS